MALQTSLAGQQTLTRRTSRGGPVIVQAYCGPYSRRMYRKFGCGPSSFGFQSSMTVDEKAIKDFVKSFFQDWPEDEVTEESSRKWFPVYGKRSKDAYVLRVELPGVSKEEIEVKANKNRRVKISYERRVSEDVEGEVDESFDNLPSGQYERLVRLPEDAVVEDLTATAENGILTVRVPRQKDESEEFVNIEVQ